MRHQQIIFIFILGIFLSLPSTSSAQLSHGGTPKSFELSFKSSTQTITTATANIDVPALLAEDAEEEKQGIPQRFGFPFDVSYNLLNSGNWTTLQDGSKLWTLQIESPGAYSINLIYDNFRISDGAEFFIYNQDRSMVIGAFTSENNKPYEKFATAPVKGDFITLELNVPAEVSYPGEISISRIVHAYRDLFYKADKAFGSSGSCNNNVNCPEGDPWSDEINSVAMIILGSGSRWCSGSMVNNVRQDLTPYFLTANHCLNEPETFIFMFNYQSPSCTNINGPTTMTLQGSTLLSTNTTSDFALLLLDDTPPDSFDIFYSGWSNVDVAASTSVGIHHPAGDIKKISFNDNSVTSTGYLTSSASNNSHWRVDDWEDGTTEGGSSGSPLFDQDHRVIGQLHGGYASCASITDDWYGKFATSWDGSASSNRLRDWLDPDNTGATTLDGIDANGLAFDVDTSIGWIPFDVQFSATSAIPIDTWDWDFGDGNFASVQNPLHNYTTPGAFDVRLDVTTGVEQAFRLKQNFIVALADTLSETDVESDPGATIVVTLNAENNIPINNFIIPVEYSGDLKLSFDSISTVGCRTEYFNEVGLIHVDAWNKRITARVQATFTDTQPDLPQGSGAILKLYFVIDAAAQGADTTVLQIDGYTSGENIYTPLFSSPLHEYQPILQPATITVFPSCCVGIRGNVDNDPGDNVDISDLVQLVDFIFVGGVAPECEEEGNVDGLGDTDISDLVQLVDFIFTGGIPPANCF